MDEQPLILVADDEAHHRKIMRSLLENAGYVVEEAADGKTALEKTASLRPALVVLDSMLDALPGLEFLDRLREDPALSGTPVMICSAKGDVDYVLACGERGARGFVHKPFAAAAFAERVQLILDETPPADMAPEPVCPAESP